MAPETPDAAHAAPDKPKPKPARTILIFVACVAVVVGIGIGLLARDAPLARPRDPQTQNAYVDGDTTPISARVQGYVRTLPIADNQFVHAGDLIATIDDTDYRADLAQADAQVGVAQAMLAAFGEREAALRMQAAQADAMLAAARAGTISTGPEAARQRVLAPTDAGLGRNVDAAVANARVTDAGIARAAAQAQAARLQLDVLAAQHRGAEATLAARQADARLAAITLTWTRIVAPIDGTLGARAVRVGTLASMGTEMVAITPLDTVWVTANFTERQIAGIVPGRPATLRLDAFPGAVLEAHVNSLSPGTGATFAGTTADNTTGNYTKVVQRVPVKLAIDWNGSPLRGTVLPGMSVTALVQTGDGAPPPPRPTR